MLKKISHRGRNPSSIGVYWGTGLFLLLTIPITFSTLETADWRGSRPGRLRKSEKTKKAKITVAWQRQPTIFTLLIVVWQDWIGILLGTEVISNPAVQTKNRWLAVLFLFRHQQIHLIGWRHVSLSCHWFVLLTVKLWGTWQLSK